MVGKVVAGEGVEQVGVVVQVSGGNSDQLSVPGRGGVLGRSGEEPGRSTGLIAHQRGSHEQRRGIGRPRPVEDLLGGGGVTADKTTEQDLDVGRHEPTVLVRADDPLTGELTPVESDGHTLAGCSPWQCSVRSRSPSTAGA